MGFLGELFTSLAFAAAFVAMAAFLFAERAARTAAPDESAWTRMGRVAFWTHIGSVMGIVGTLFYLIYTHQYQYHYVWSHSSNELPVYYMISCFWEGQEGSFLLWAFWHAVLGGIVMRQLRNTPWLYVVMAVIASVEMILTSMLLGAYVSEPVVSGIFGAMLLLPLGWLVWTASRDRASLREPFTLASLLLGLSAGSLLLRGQGGFTAGLTFSNMLSNVSGIAFTLFVLAGVAYGVWLFARLRKDGAFNATWFAGLGVFVVAMLMLFFEASQWKVGSTPFLSLKAALPDADVFKTDANFIPKNGTGLNPLLQNYWMVIHPPTLFLGFASTLIPFAFVVAGLVRRKYTEWIKLSMPWLLFSAMILGVGIIMGGYWAYETLNFGGYWNWDPVENSSFVPWLMAVASLHGLLIYQKTKGYLHLSMVMVILTFVLVLYSTFLTRSGVLGETSVHTFTDLGLSGQLLVLFFVYAIGITALLIYRWRSIPAREDESGVWTAEFFLFLGVLVFLFSGAEIMFSTSLPVFNKIFGTSLAPPVNVPLFYYKWNVWFAIAFGVFSGIGQFLWWRRAEEKKLADALFRPFLIAIVSGTSTLMALMYFRWEFAYTKEFEAGNLAYRIVFDYADELLLFAVLFGLMANIDVLIGLLRKNSKGLKVMGGTVVHIGFALMMLGILFSSGYDTVISRSLTPEDMAGFPEKDKADNLMLVKDEPRYMFGTSQDAPEYMATYLGKVQAMPPFSEFKVLEIAEKGFKVTFRDSQDERYAFVMPLDVFLKKGDNKHNTVQPTSNTEPTADDIDLKYVNEFITKNIDLIRDEIPLINGRTIFKIKFQDPNDTTKSFMLYPESEMNEDMGSILSHPSRKVLADKDIYVHVSSVPKGESEEEPKFNYYNLSMKIGDTAHAQNAVIRLDRVFDVSGQMGEEAKNMRLAVAADLKVIVGVDTFTANPIYLISNDNQPGMIESSIEKLHLDFAFVGADPKAGVVNIQVQQRTNPKEEWIVIKAIRKPYINLLWLGTFVLTFGFGISIYRRWKVKG